MTRRLRQIFRGVVIASVFLAIQTAAQQGAKNGEWRVYGGDEASTRYSPLATRHSALATRHSVLGTEHRPARLHVLADVLDDRFHRGPRAEDAAHVEPSLTEPPQADPIAGELVTETLDYDGGRQVTVYIPPGPPEADARSIRLSSRPMRDRRRTRIRE